MADNEDEGGDALTFRFNFTPDGQMTMDREIDTTVIDDPDVKDFATRFFEGLSFMATTEPQEIYRCGVSLQMAERSMVSAMFNYANQVSGDETEDDIQASKERVH